MSLALPERDVAFLLHELLRVEQLTERPRYRDHDRATFDQSLNTARELADSHFAPHNALADRDEPHFDGANVHILPEAKEAVTQFADAGFLGATHDYEWNGLQLPHCIAQACMAHFYAANVSTSAYSLLTIAAANLLRAHGSSAQLAQYLPAMLDGRCLGTMCLSEPQAGSSLADIRTSATYAQGGHYLIRGSKMWISGGDHDLSENIVHMVLARMDDAPPGVKGISLFVVPKFLVNSDGSLGERNGVRLDGINHKMGYRGTVNTVLGFGQERDCVGYLVGEAHAGLAAMFHMMNEARIAIGLGATALGLNSSSEL